MCKHVKLPFTLYGSVSQSPFDLIHYDVWTSSITSVIGIKCYVIFLDNYSHFLSIYPLHAKSDAKFMCFRSFVKNQSNTEIKSFQCDNGG